MNAENVLLTHFSARYPKVPLHLAAPGSPSDSGPTVALALDHSRVRIGEMAKLRAYAPAIRQSFAEIPEEDDVNEAEVLW